MPVSRSKTYWYIRTGGIFLKENSWKAYAFQIFIVIYIGFPLIIARVHESEKIGRLLTVPAIWNGLFGFFLFFIVSYFKSTSKRDFNELL